MKLLKFEDNTDISDECFDKMRGRSFIALSCDKELCHILIHANRISPVDAVYVMQKAITCILQNDDFEEEDL